MRFLPFALLLTSCLAPGVPGPNWPRGFLFQDRQPGIAFTTPLCGLRVLKRFPEEPPLEPEWNQARVEDLVIRACTAFRNNAQLLEMDPRFNEPCSRLQGWQVYVVASKDIQTEYGTLAGGEAKCETNRIFVGNSPPEVGRLAHELAHAIQDCDANLDGIMDVGEQHFQWGFVYAALRDAGLPL